MSSLSKFNSGIKFLLIVIDIFSRFVWVQPLRNKTGKEVVEGFKQIVQKGRKCKKLTTDKGSEFTNLQCIRLKIFQMRRLKEIFMSLNYKESIKTRILSGLLIKKNKKAHC